MTAPHQSAPSRMESYSMSEGGRGGQAERLSCLWVDNRSTTLNLLCAGFGLTRSHFCLAKDQNDWLALINDTSIGLLISHLPIQNNALSQHLENVARIQPWSRVFLLHGNVAREPFLRELAQAGSYFWRRLNDADDYVGAYHFLNARAQFV